MEMQTLHFRRMILVMGACLGMLAPHGVTRAEGPRKTSPAAPTVSPARIVDVVMAPGGNIAGQVLDSQGVPLERMAVSVHQGDREVARTVSGRNGTFLVQNLRGGAYEVRAGKARGVFRFWTPDAAPPSARHAAVIVSGSPVVRGQLGAAGVTGLAAMGAAAAVGGTVAAVSLADDDDSERSTGPATANQLGGLTPITLDTIGTPITGVDLRPASP